MERRARISLRARPHLLAVVAGALYALGFPGADVWPLSLLFAWPLFWLLDGPPLNARRALSVGLLFGLSTHSLGYYWLPQTLERFAAMPWLVALGVSVLLFAYQGGQLALFFLVCWRARQLGREVLLWAPPALAAVELAYPLLFPSYLANSTHRLWPVMQLAELGGPTLVSAFWLTLGCALYAVVVRRPAGLPWLPRMVGMTLALAVLALAWGVHRGRALEDEIAAAPRRTLGIVQANIGHADKHSDEAQSIALHAELSRALEGAQVLDLLVWPESVLQRPLAQDEMRLSARVPRLATPLLTGALAWGGPPGATRLTNAAVLADAGGRVLGRYDKVRLLPFAEYLPFESELPWLRRLAPAAGRLSGGEDLAPLTLGDARLGVLVCYEDVLPAFVRSVVREGDPQLLVNLTNDAWFGDTTEPFIHLALAKLRAVEQRRYLVRATNSGVSAVVDPLGRVVVATGTFERATRVAQVALLSSRTLYRTLGDWPGMLALLVLAPGLWRTRKVDGA